MIDNDEKYVRFIGRENLTAPQKSEQTTTLLDNTHSFLVLLTIGANLGTSITTFGYKRFVVRY